MDSTVRQEKPFGSDHGLVHEAVVTGRKVGAGEEFWATLAHDEAMFRRVVDLVNGSPAPVSTPVTIDQAATIMGTNFHGVEALEKLLGRNLAKRAKATLNKGVPFSAETLEACRDTHVLVACAGISLMEVWSAQTALFYAKSDPWYKSQQFATTKVKVGWYLVRKTPVPDSTSKTWAEQCELLTEMDEVTSASVLAQAILIHYLETKERLFEAIYVRVSDVASGGIRVNLGNFNQDGLNVNNNWDTNRNSNIGVSASRKFS